ncbi:hypothetical protein CathTA2_0865 [Caldalkalibacillus thermarum TA2.A1]|uniref:Uncharacterized protein n=1 Tax=Caldalkalibacillus thermarum (strain TA2.A1) TaxID=986075 RepID=F5L502_CALTT|nr:hypothetical protein [Caldalkalibacillus thermarum]EGL83578.1 hypothetical protein CathTA2_0865 [Caldalkalibacillus thermarum TA2.A1]QZT35122.1 hypothetical protein HUR95_07865 [Caldalkalibacillus thermarum TA2.A1]
MGYYPPYLPDSYRLAMNMIPPVQPKITKVQAVSKKEVNSVAKRYARWPEEMKRDTRKGIHFDEYI